MSSGDIEPFDWSRRFFGLERRGFFDDMFRGFDQMKQEMEREFEDMEKIETAKSNYNNGILEITFKKKEQTKGKTIKAE